MQKISGAIILSIKGHCEANMDKPLILVVDDNHINRLFFESALKKNSCACISTSNGSDALKQCHLYQFDLILMDIRMKDMNGIETAARVKQIKRNQTTPIVAISAETFDVDTHRDFIGSLLKPVSREDLNHTIAALIKPQTHENHFNHAKALDFSNQNQQIASHLRDMFIQQLKPQLQQIVDQFENKKFNDLHDTLHHLLGSAKICAAERLIYKIEAFKYDLNEMNDNLASTYLELIETIKKTAEQ